MEILREYIKNMPNQSDLLGTQQENKKEKQATNGGSEWTRMEETWRWTGDATHTQRWWVLLSGSCPASLAREQECRSHWWSPDSGRTGGARYQVAAERCSGLSPLQRELEEWVEGRKGGGRGQGLVYRCADMGTGDREREEEGKKRQGRHKNIWSKNMKRERGQDLWTKTVSQQEWQISNT